MVRSGKAVVLALVVFAAGCSGGDSGGGPPSIPALLVASPLDGAASLKWGASPGATSYELHYSTTPLVTRGSPSVAAASSPASVPSLANGVPYWFAVAAVGAGGTSALSDVACAVPTAAPQAGLTLLDPLCGTTLAGSRFWPPGLLSSRVVDGAMELSAAMGDMQPFGTTGAQYNVAANVPAAAGVRVTTLATTMSVPSATAALGGSGVQVRAAARLFYSPPARRLNFPNGSQDVLVFEAGLLDAGTGLKAYRAVLHCDDGSCAESSTTGITFSDPEGWVDGPPGATATRVADAAYETPYTVEVRLDEGTGVFHWRVAGGAFGAGVGGTADPTGYVSGASAPASWTSVPVVLAGNGYAGALLNARVRDGSAAGGGHGRLTARFDDVEIATNADARAPYDDFSGAGGNSGPEELSAAKWQVPGARATSAPGGSLAMTHRITGLGSPITATQALALASPASVDTLQADVRFAAATWTPSAGASVMMRGRFFNDGSGTTPGSAVGDVLASVMLRAMVNDAYYRVVRCTQATCGTAALVAEGVVPGATVGSGVHTLLLKWDPAAHEFTLGVDDARVVVDPTTAGVTVGGPALAPLKDILTVVSVPGVAGETASLDVRVNNMFVAP